MIIEVPDFPFWEALSKKALQYCSDHIDPLYLYRLATRQVGTPERFKERLIENTYSIPGTDERTFYILDIVKYLNRVKLEHEFEKYTDRVHEFIDELILELHLQLRQMGYRVQEDSFSVDELISFEEKIDVIIRNTQQLAHQNEDLQATVEELKDDLIKSKYLTIFGKKVVRLNLIGIVAQYAAEEGLKAIWPGLKDILQSLSGIGQQSISEWFDKLLN